MPSPGHVSIAAGSVEFKAERPKRLARNVSLGFKGARKLPEAVRVLWGARSFPSPGGVTYAVVVLVVRKDEVTPSPAGRARDTRARRDGGEKPRLYEIVPCGAEFCMGGRVHGPNRTSAACDSCGGKGVKVKISAAKDADDETLESDLFEAVKKTKKNASVFRMPNAFDANLDTGHYDDGHAFGWDVKGKRDERAVLKKTIDVFLNGDEGEMIERVEMATGSDLNANGSIGFYGSGSFARSPSCQFNVDPPNCPYLTATASFTSPLRAFEIEVPGYIADPADNVDVSLFNEGGAPIGVCSTTSPRGGVHCEADFRLEAGSRVSTTIATLTGPSSDDQARLPDGHGGSLYVATPGPKSKRLAGAFPIVGP